MPHFPPKLVLVLDTHNTDKWFLGHLGSPGVTSLDKAFYLDHGHSECGMDKPYESNREIFTTTWII